MCLQYPILILDMAKTSNCQHESTEIALQNLGFFPLCWVWGEGGGCLSLVVISLRRFSGTGVSNSLIPKCYTFLESGGLAELISEEKIKIFLHNKILVLQILLYNTVNFRCRWQNLFLKIDYRLFRVFGLL